MRCYNPAFALCAAYLLGAQAPVPLKLPQVPATGAPLAAAL